MKNIIDFINESRSDLTIDDIYFAIQEIGINDIDWNKELKNHSVRDILKSNSMLKDMAKILNVSEKNLISYIDTNEDELCYRLNDLS
jgi:hypothetical protein